MASILLMSEKGNSLPLANSLARHGHLVKMHLNKKNGTFLQGSKNPTQVQAPRMLDQYDLIIEEPSTDRLEGAFMNDPLVTKLHRDTEYRNKVLNFLYGDRRVRGRMHYAQLLGWFGDEGFVPPLFLCRPYIRLMDGDRGPMTSGMGCVVTPDVQPDKVMELFGPFTEFLQKINYQGLFGVQALICKEQFVPLGPTAWDCCTLLGIQEVLRQDLGQALLDLKLKGKPRQDFLQNTYAVSVRLTLPPWPYGGQWPPINEPVVQVPEPALKHFHLGASDLGQVGVVTARGDDAREAKRRAYRTIQNTVQQQDVQFRSDIGDQCEDLVKDLREWGWLA